jgi:hypothetical protein
MKNPRVKPEDEVIATNKVAIDAALQRYNMEGNQALRPAKQHHEAWKGVVKLKKSITKIRNTIAAIGVDPLNPGDQRWLMRIAADLSKLREVARARVEVWRPKSREELLINDLLRIWEGATGVQPRTSTGPGARFLCKQLPWGPDEVTARRYIRDYKEKRLLISEMAATGALFVDPDKVLLMDKDGNIIQGR